MKNISLCFSFFVVLVCGKATAQNLVPNGNFDEVVECPSFLGELHTACAHWYHGIQIPDQPWYNWPSPDWFHECATHPNLGVPMNFFGYQDPCTGSGYAGFISFRSTTPNVREIMSNSLIETLVVGHLYEVSFKVSRATNNSSSRACNNFGIRFTTFAHWDSSHKAIDNFAHLNYDEVISQSGIWTPLHFDFVADSAYSFLHIGNFFTDDQTISVEIPDELAPLQCYYYVDCVEVQDKSLSASQRINSLNEFTVYPNPSQDWIAIHSSKGIKSYAIANVNGSIVAEGNESATINISSLSKGIYFLRFEDENGKFSFSKIIKTP